MNSKYRTHLTLEDRCTILSGIKSGATLASIAKVLGKDNSTIGKEIKARRYIEFKCKLPLECNGYKTCKYGRDCTPDCPDYKPFQCRRRDHTPGTCDGCSNRPYCRFNRYTYNPVIADNQYRYTLSDSRQGVNLTSKEAASIGAVVAPLLHNGQSPYQIISNHPELNICEKTLYNYIEDGVLKEVAGITVMDLRRQVSRKIPKKRSKLYKKRIDRKYLLGREYKDYLAFIDENSTSRTTEMDTVYNDESTGPFIQTFKFLGPEIFFAFLHKEKTANSMVMGINRLEEILGPAVFRKYVNVLLTDRGSEFSAADAMEKDKSNALRCRVFYCDPMRSNQKGSLENKHIELRYILPKGTDLYRIGLTDQNKLNLVLSHLNSSPHEKLNGRTPLQVAKFMYPDLYEPLSKFGITEIDADDVILKPSLLK